MRPSLFLSAAVALTLTASSALAQAAAAPLPALPQAYGAYSQPEITQCATPDANTVECTVPAMTAGRYLIEALGFATSTGANATQTLQIKLDGASCVATNPAPFTGKAGLHVGCEVSFLTDHAIKVSAVYTTANGTPDAKGPKLVFHRVPWNGIVTARGVAFRAKSAPAK